MKIRLRGCPELLGDDCVSLRHGGGNLGWIGDPDHPAGRPGKLDDDLVDHGGGVKVSLSVTVIIRIVVELSARAHDKDNTTASVCVRCSYSHVWQTTSRYAEYRRGSLRNTICI